MRINTHVGNVGIKLDTKRLDKNKMNAQKILNLTVRTDCEPLVPLLNGQLRRSANFPDGIYGGVLEYNTPYAHAIYEGYVFTPNIPIKDSDGNITGWYSPPGQKKEKTNRKMTFHEPGTTDHFFEEAKKKHGEKWIRLVKDEMGKG